MSADAPFLLYIGLVLVGVAAGASVVFLNMRARRQLLGRLQRLSAVVEQTADAVVITDDQAVICYVNPAFEEMAGYSSEEVMGENPRMLQSGVHDKRFYERFWAVLKSGRTFKGTLINKRRDGTLISVQQTISPILTDGAITHYVSLWKDTTEQRRLMSELEHNLAELKQTQSQLIQSAKMSAVGELAAGVAHELNNPLSGVLTYAVLLAEALEKAPEETRAALPDFPERLKLVKIAAERCKAITDNLLAFSRQSESEMRPLDLSAVVSSTFGLLAARLRSRRIVVVRDVPDGLPQIRGNANELQQILTNILLNAADAMEDGGKLAVTVEHDSDEARCEITITDDGRGIAPPELDRIFEPFYTTKPVGKGTGLGLSIAYGLVQDHGGEIEVDSVMGQGTTVRVRLPVAGRPGAE